MDVRNFAADQFLISCTKFVAQNTRGGAKTFGSISNQKSRDWNFRAFWLRARNRCSQNVIIKDGTYLDGLAEKEGGGREEWAGRGIGAKVLGPAHILRVFR